jgi:hypothetical protein
MKVRNYYRRRETESVTVGRGGKKTKNSKNLNK